MQPPDPSVCSSIAPSQDQDSTPQLGFDYARDGIVYLRDFLSCDLLVGLKQDMLRAEAVAEEDLRERWQERKLCFYSRDPKKASGEEAHVDYVTQPYFLASGDRTHIFYETIAGKNFVNRIGHGMHLDPRFPSLRKIVYEHPKLHAALKTLGYRRPICHLSVYIPKHPDEVGSDVRPHQESTFAYTTPQSVIVLWIALDDVDVENACMWGVPGSHRFPLSFVSRVDHVRRERTFERVSPAPLPDFNQDRAAFVPLEVAAGDAILFHGNFVHCSPINKSRRGRPALSCQFIETDACAYDPCNWLQPVNSTYLFDHARKDLL